MGGHSTPGVVVTRGRRVMAYPAGGFDNDELNNAGIDRISPESGQIGARFGPYFCQPAIARLGAEDKPFICTMDSIGAKELEKDFLVAGTSSESLYGACDA
ncbi:hypothetical protein Dimus_031658 [Dionaea muscipula]